MADTRDILSNELLWLIASHLEFKSWVTFFYALADTPRRRELSPSLGQDLIRQIEFELDPELSDPTFDKRQMELLEEGLRYSKSSGKAARRSKARWQACMDEASERLEVNKRKVGQVLRMVADTAVTPHTRDFILSLLVDKILRVFSVTHIFFEGIDEAGDNFYTGYESPNRYQKTRCHICETHFYKQREVVRFRILPEADIEGKLSYSCSSLGSGKAPGPKNSDLYVDIEGYLLVRQVLGAGRMEYVEGLAADTDLEHLDYINRDEDKVMGGSPWRYWRYWRTITLCTHETAWLILGLLKNTMSEEDFFALTKPFYERIIEKGPHKYCRVCIDMQVLGHAVVGTCSNKQQENQEEQENQGEEW